MLAVGVPGLHVGREVADARLCDDRIDLLAIERKGFRCRKAAIADVQIPPGVELQTVATEHGIQTVLIPPADPLAMRLEVLEDALFRPLAAPPREIDDQYARVEVLLVRIEAELPPCRQAVRRRHAEHDPISGRGDRMTCEIELPERAEIAFDQDVGVEIDHAMDRARQQAADENSEIRRDLNVAGHLQLGEPRKIGDEPLDGESLARPRRREPCATPGREAAVDHVQTKRARRIEVRDERTNHHRKRHGIGFVGGRDDDRIAAGVAHRRAPQEITYSPARGGWISMNGEGDCGSATNGASTASGAATRPGTQ